MPAIAGGNEVQPEDAALARMVDSMNIVGAWIETQLPGIEHHAAGSGHAGSRVDAVCAGRINIRIETADAVGGIGRPEMSVKVAGGRVDGGSVQNEAAKRPGDAACELCSCGLRLSGRGSDRRSDTTGLGEWVAP